MRGHVAAGGHDLIALMSGETLTSLGDDTMTGNGATTFVLNAKEPATENPVTLAVCEKFERARSGSTQAVVWDDLPANHDIIDPTNPNARIDLVYPRLRAIVDGSL